MQKTLNLSGRILFALPFLLFGLNHLYNYNEILPVVPAFIPGGVLWVWLSGLAMIFAAFAIVGEKHEDIACIAMAVLLLAHIATVHFPELINPQKSLLTWISLLKDVGLMGAALYMAGNAKKNP